MFIKKLIRVLFESELETKEYYKKDEEPIRRNLTDKVGRTYFASSISGSKKSDKTCSLK